MLAAKQHLAVSSQSGAIYRTGTLCGRDNSILEDDGHVDQFAAVTCKLCLKYIADRQHWRHRKYLSSTT